MNEKLFQRIANEYMEQSGAELRKELDALEAEEMPQITSSLDRRVAGELSALRRKGFMKTAGLIAACLVFALLLPGVLRQQQSSPPPEMSASPPSSGISALAAFEIIPLSFTMPDQFSISSVEQDIEKTIYYIKDAGQDNIVMTLEYAESIEAYSGLTPVYIGDFTAYGRVEQGYRLLAFEKQGVLYVLTCEYDINTLVELGVSILKNV